MGIVSDWLSFIFDFSSTRAALIRLSVLVIIVIAAVLIYRVTLGDKPRPIGPEGNREIVPSETGGAIEAFTDDVSNWYVRASRRRFWGGRRGGDEGADAAARSDADAAFATLHECLATVALLVTDLDREALIASLPGKGLSYVINVACEADEFDVTREMTRRYPFIYAASSRA